MNVKKCEFIVRACVNNLSCLGCSHKYDAANKIQVRQRRSTKWRT